MWSTARPTAATLTSTGLVQGLWIRLNKDMARVELHQWPGHPDGFTRVERLGGSYELYFPDPLVGREFDLSDDVHLEPLKDHKQQPRINELLPDCGAVSIEDRPQSLEFVLPRQCDLPYQNVFLKLYFSL